MDFKAAFRHTLPHEADPGLLSLLSPSGKRLASTRRDGLIRITQVPDGKPLMSIELEDMPRPTCLGWAANSNIFVGDDVGGVMQFNVTRNPVICAHSLPAISYISTRRNSPVKAIAFDIRRCLLAIALDGEVQICGIYLVDEAQHEWGAIDVVKCEQNGTELQVSNVDFFGAHHYLLITTEHGFIIWKDEDKSLSYFKHNPHDIPFIGQCVVSPDNRTLAGSGQDHTIRIWPLSDEGPIMDQVQRSFIIRTRQNSATAAAPAPIAFLDKYIVTTNSTDTVYIISLDGELRSTFSIEENHCIRSILADKTMINVIAMGPARSTLIIGYTNDEATYNEVKALHKESENTGAAAP